MQWYKFLKAFGQSKVGDVCQLDEADAKGLVEKGFLEKTDDDPLDEAVKTATEDLKDNLQKAVKIQVAEALKGLQVEYGEEDGPPLIVLGKAPEDKDPFFGYAKDTEHGVHGRFALDVKAMCNPAISTPERLEKYMLARAAASKAASGMSENIGEDGGVLVLDQLSTEIWRKAFPEEDLMARTDQRTVPGNSVVYNSIVENSRASGSRHGGVRGYWMGEADQFTTTKPKFTKIRFILSKLGVFVHATDELVDDVTGISLQAELTELSSKELRFLIGDALINGNGIVKPTGLLQAGSLIAVARTTATRVKGADIFNMWNRLHVSARANAIWLINQDVEPQLDQMFIAIQNVAGTENVGGFPLYMPPGGIADAAYGRLKGRPVIAVEWTAALGTVGDIILVDFGQYRTVTKGGINSAMSIHLRFDYGESVFRFTFRADGQSMWPAALTPYKGTSTHSHIIALAAG